MQTIVQQISDLTKLNSILEWIWYGQPLSTLDYDIVPLIGGGLDAFPRGTKTTCLIPWSDVDMLIFKTPIQECLRSQSKYIYECKMWFLNLSLEDTLRFIMRDIFNLETYLWQGEPASINMTEEAIYGHFRSASMHLYMDNDQTYTNEQNRQFAKRNYNCIVEVDNVIKNSDDNLALTSSVPYIRECKRWFIDSAGKRDLRSTNLQCRG